MKRKCTNPPPCLTANATEQPERTLRDPDAWTYETWLEHALRKVNGQLNRQFRDHPLVDATEIAADIVSGFFAQTHSGTSPGGTLAHFLLFAERRAIDVARKITNRTERLFVRYPAGSEVSHEEWLAEQAGCAAETSSTTLEEIDEILSRVCAFAGLETWQVSVVRAVLSEEATITEVAKNHAVKRSTVRSWARRVQAAAPLVTDRC